MPDVRIEMATQLVDMRNVHTYRPEIPEPVPSLSLHGAPFVGIWVSPAIKIIVIRQMCMSPTSAAV